MASTAGSCSLPLGLAGEIFVGPGISTGSPFSLRPPLSSQPTLRPSEFSSVLGDSRDVLDRPGIETQSYRLVVVGARYVQPALHLGSVPTFEVSPNHRIRIESYALMYLMMTLDISIFLRWTATVRLVGRARPRGRPLCQCISTDWDTSPEAPETRQPRADSTNRTRPFWLGPLRRHPSH